MSGPGETEGCLGLPPSYAHVVPPSCAPAPSQNPGYAPDYQLCQVGAVGRRPQDFQNIINFIGYIDSMFKIYLHNKL